MNTWRWNRHTHVPVCIYTDHLKIILYCVICVKFPRQKRLRVIDGKKRSSRPSVSSWRPTVTTCLCYRYRVNISDVCVPSATFSAWWTRCRTRNLSGRTYRSPAETKECSNVGNLRSRYVKQRKAQRLEISGQGMWNKGILKRWKSQVKVCETKESSKAGNLRSRYVNTQQQMINLLQHSLKFTFLPLVVIWQFEKFQLPNWPTKFLPYYRI